MITCKTYDYVYTGIWKVTKNLWNNLGKREK